MEMSEEISQDTLVAGENVQPVNTDTETETQVEAKSENVDAPKASSVEQRDGKMFVDGVRVYTRDDTNKIAANAKRDVESKLLQELDVDSMDKVKSVVKQLQTADLEQDSLNVSSLRDAVKKKEQTVEELKAELQSVRTDFALKEHVGSLKDNMPGAWDQNQKQAVVDLMKARDMLHYQDGTFAIKAGDEFLTTDGETPDYKSAVEHIGKTLGLTIGRKGIDTFDSDKQPGKAGADKGLNEDKLKLDPHYRSAYLNLREKQKISHGQITDSMVKKQMDARRSGLGSNSLIR
jgi:hypothetical protein|tara:strand:- start:32 stop:904 length:873 start_codon:yes stop_codon:yes gene_type:complete